MEGSFIELVDLSVTVVKQLAEMFDELATLCAECAKNIENFASSLQLLDEVEVSSLLPKKAVRRKPRPDYKAKCKIRWLDIPNKVMQGRIHKHC